MSAKKRRQNLQKRPSDASEYKSGREVIRMKTSFTGPVPPPKMLEQYNNVLPNAAERIVAMAERQSAHRQKLEEIVIKSSSRNELIGQIFALIIALFVVGGGIYLLVQGKDAAGLAAIITPLAVLTGVFVYGKHLQRKELENKNPNMRPRR